MPRKGRGPTSHGRRCSQGRWSVSRDCGLRRHRLSSGTRRNREATEREAINSTQDMYFSFLTKVKKVSCECSPCERNTRHVRVAVHTHVCDKPATLQAWAPDQQPDTAWLDVQALRRHPEATESENPGDETQSPACPPARRGRCHALKFESRRSKEASVLSMRSGTLWR